MARNKQGQKIIPHLETQNHLDYSYPFKLRKSTITQKKVPFRKMHYVLVEWCKLYFYATETRLRPHCYFGFDYKNIIALHRRNEAYIKWWHKDGEDYVAFWPIVDGKILALNTYYEITEFENLLDKLEREYFDEKSS